MWTNETDDEVFSYTPGDVDSNGAVDVNDALLVLQFCVKLYTPDDTQAAAADVDGDGNILVSDALQNLRYCVKLFSSFD